MQGKISKEIFNIVSRNTLVTIYKLFVRFHIDYCDIVYDQPNNEKFFNKKSLYRKFICNNALAITCAIKETQQIMF